MDEIMETGVETEASGDTSMEEAFEAGWNDEDDVSFEQEQPEGDGEGADNEAPEAEETDGGDTSPEEKPAEEPHEEAPSEEQEQKPEEQQAAQPQTFELDYMGQKVTKTADEMKALAQMGMDYPRLRQDYDDAKPIISLAKKWAKEAGMTLAQYAAHSEEQALIKSGEAASPEEARDVMTRRQHDAEYREWKERQAAEEREAQDAEARKAADLAEFRRMYPDAAEKPDTIPAEVWQEVAKGSTLTNAYSRFAQKKAEQEAQAARDELAAYKKNNANRQKSTGSMAGTGAGQKGRDPFLEGLDE